MGNERQGEPALRALVPELARELAQLPSPIWATIDGSLVAADMSGFTALTEQLSAKGRAGAEEITARVNDCFAALIDEAGRVGGDVLKFGGDSMLMLVRGDDHERRAASAGLAMQRALRASATARRARLSMTVAVAAGPFDVFVVGDDARDLMITGAHVDTLIQLDGAANAGDVIVDHRIAQCLSAEMTSQAQGDGFTIHGAPSESSVALPRRVEQAERAEHASLRPFVAGAIVDHLAAFARLGGEHRLATMGFVQVAGLGDVVAAHGHAKAADELHCLYLRLVAVCQQFGVTVLHSDVSIDGVKLLLCAGAPITVGDTHDAVLHTALELATINSPFTIRQGIQSGRVFAGFLGSPSRCAYTVMGDAANTAARMLGKAADREVVAVSTVLDQCRSIFVEEHVEPFHVKGKSAPIDACVVRAATGRTRRNIQQQSLIGRDAELTALQHAVGRGGAAVELIGAPGTGKTRLLDELRNSVDPSIVTIAECTPFGAATPFGVAQNLLRRLGGVSPDATVTAAGAQLTKLATRVAPHLTAMLPLIALAFGAEVTATPESQTVNPAFRAARIHAGVVDLLDAVTSGEPLGLIVEDAHWVDASSGDLLNHLVRAAASRRWTIIASRRPTDAWSMAALPHVTSLALGPLSEESTRRLAIGVSASPLRDSELDLVMQRAQGNPLFAIELARVLGDRAHDGDDLPDTIEQIIANRLDRLNATALRVVRVASVLGNSFDETTVAAVVEAADDSADVAAAFRDAHRAGALVHRGGSEWAFDHALYRDAAYTALPFRRRQHLHRLAAEIIEGSHTDPTPIAAVLCLHYSRARDHDRTWTYGRIAGEVAEQQHATAEAIVSYERARDAGRFSRTISNDQRADFDEKLGDLYYIAARFGDAERSMRRAGRRASDPVARARLERKLAAVFERQGRTDLALRTYQHAASRAPGRTRSRAWLVERTHALLGEAASVALRGDNRECVALAQRALQDAMRTSDDALTTLAFERLHLGKSGLALPGAEAIGQQAVALYTALNDPNGLSRTLNNLGVEAYFDSRWTDASRYYTAAADAAARSGHLVLVANAVLNNAVILADQGHWDASLAQFDDAGRNFAAVGHLAGLAAQRLFSTIPLMWRGDLDEAVERLTDARNRLTDLRFADLTPQLVSRELQLAVLLGRSTPQLFESTADQLGNQPSFVSQLARCRAAVLYDNGDASGAYTTLVNDVADPLRVGYERAITFHALAEMFPGDPAAGVWQSESAALRADLGVVRLPPLRPTDLSNR